MSTTTYIEIASDCKDINLIRQADPLKITIGQRKILIADLDRMTKIAKSLNDTDRKKKKDNTQADRDALLKSILGLPNVVCEIEVGDRHFDLTLEEALSGNVKGNIPNGDKGEKLVQVVMQGNRVKALQSNVDKLVKMLKGESIRVRKNSKGEEVVVELNDKGEEIPTVDAEGTLPESAEAPKVAPESVEVPEVVVPEVAPEATAAPKKGKGKGKGKK